MLLEKSFTLVVIIIVVAVVVGERRKAPEGEIAITLTITTTIKSSFHCVFITFFRFYFWFWPKHFIQLLAAPLDFSFFIFHPPNRLQINPTKLRITMKTCKIMGKLLDKK